MEKRIIQIFLILLFIASNLYAIDMGTNDITGASAQGIAQYGIRMNKYTASADGSLDSVYAYMRKQYNYPDTVIFYIYDDDGQPNNLLYTSDTLFITNDAIAWLVTSISGSLVLIIG